jgi:hypothetical protein
MRLGRRFRSTVVCLAAGLTLAAVAPLTSPAQAREAAPPPVAAARSTPKVGHVFVIVVENKGFDTLWGDASSAPYLVGTLRKKGVLLTQYYGTAHNSQPNYIAMVSGQGPNPDMQADCQNFSDFIQVGTANPGQLRGSGCVFPSRTPTLMTQLDARHVRWRGYAEDMARRCQHPEIGQRDATQSATATSQYAARHNPFVYFHDVIDRPAYCRRHVVPLQRLRHNLKHPASMPRLSYIVPDLCSDGHDTPCVDGRPGGTASIDAFMKKWVPRILRSRSFRHDGLLVVTADESDSPAADATACCGETTPPNTPLAGITGPGGGRTGTLVISRWTRANTTSAVPYNHYSLLASLEEIFGLSRLGFAAAPGPTPFGSDVYSRP